LGATSSEGGQAITIAARTTTAAERLPRRRFTVAEVEAMVAAGVMREDERVELIGGNRFRCRQVETSMKLSRSPCCAVGTASRPMISTCAGNNISLERGHLS
jgi:hypothetical protein